MISGLGRRWELRCSPGEQPREAASAQDVLQELLRIRGICSDKEARARFLQPRLADLTDPFLLPDMQEAVERVLQAVDAGENVVIFGDYDVDGITSIALLRAVLKAYGLDPRPFIPRRSQEGYGISYAGIERCMEQGAKPDLLIAVDCGTPSLDEVASLTHDGVDVVILDHHEPSEEGKPDCVAMVNPKSGETYRYLCSAGVVFKLAHALLKTRPLEDFDLRDYTDLVAVATIADIVPLVDENRLLVRHGLSRLSKTQHPGLGALQAVAGLENGASTSGDVGFRIGPRINAAGRMDKPEEALKTLLASSQESANEFARQLDGYNRQRQDLEKRIRDEAMAEIAARQDFDNEACIVLGSRTWHPGVVGIVASRLMRQFHKPSFVIAIDGNGIGKGSGRSIEGLSLVQAIRHCGDTLLGGGGHDMAAGLSIHEDQIDAFRAMFSDYVKGNLDTEQRRPKVLVDVDVPLEVLSLDFMRSYDQLQPFGSGNPQPVFITRNVHLTEAPRRLKNNHLKLMLRQGYAEREAIFFSGGEHRLPDPPWDLAFTIDQNTFRGRTTLQMIVQDLRASEG